MYIYNREGSLRQAYHFLLIKCTVTLADRADFVMSWCLVHNSLYILLYHIWCHCVHHTPVYCWTHYLSWSVLS